MVDRFPWPGELERQVMQLIWAHAPITSESVRMRLDRRLKESTVRTVLRRLEEKGFVTHGIDGRTFVFRAVEDRQNMAARGIRRIADSFYGGSIEDLIVGIVDAKMLDRKHLEELSKRLKKRIRRE